jgi:hypothetical protein
MAQIGVVDPERALAKFAKWRGCNTNYWRREMLSEMAVEEPLRALALVDSIRNPSGHARVQIVVARYLAPADPIRSREIMGDARAWLRS